jgi:hypothetical protein
MGQRADDTTRKLEEYAPANFISLSTNWFFLLFTKP